MVYNNSSITLGKDVPSCWPSALSSTGPLHCALPSLDATGQSDSAFTLLESEGNYSAVQYSAVHYTVAL